MCPSPARRSAATLLHSRVSRMRLPPDLNAHPATRPHMRALRGPRRLAPLGNGDFIANLSACSTTQSPEALPGATRPSWTRMRRGCYSRRRQCRGIDMLSPYSRYIFPRNHRLAPQGPARARRYDDGRGEAEVVLIWRGEYVSCHRISMRITLGQVNKYHVTVFVSHLRTRWV
jgi:hypothetical protein